jgi:hypothetical protein
MPAKEPRSLTYKIGANKLPGNPLPEGTATEGSGWTGGLIQSVALGTKPDQASSTEAREYAESGSARDSRSTR